MLARPPRMLGPALPDSVRRRCARRTAVLAAAFACATIPLRAQTAPTGVGTDSSRAPEPVWPVPGPPPLPGSVLPAKRIVAFYGNPLSKRMGILGELPPKQMLAKLDTEVAAWERADPSTPVQRALHLIAVVAQGDAGRDGKYRMKMRDTLVERVHGWARDADALLFLDIQVGLSTIQEEVPRFESFLMRPDVHLGIDPEFAMRGGTPPGRKIGSYDADDINDVIDYLAALVTRHNLPPKVLVVHRFTRRMVTGFDRIKRDPRVQVVMHMDGWGTPASKRATYDAYVFNEPVQYPGFKLFYKNDTRRGGSLMTPAELLGLVPRPLYIQYQ
jgi:hypothetical protein